MLSYAFKTVMTLIQIRDYRNQLLRELINLYRHTAAATDSITSSSPDWVQMVQCLIFLDDPNTVNIQCSRIVLSYFLKTYKCTPGIYLHTSIFNNIFQSSQVAAVLEELSQGSQDDALMAYQIAFDLYESATQQFLNNVVQAVRKTAPIPIAIATGGLSSKGTQIDSNI